MANGSDHLILICSTCKGVAAADAMAAMIAPDLPAGFAIRHVDCMSGCDRPMTVGVQAKGKAQYLFGDVGPDDCPALTAFAQQFRDSADGWTKATERPRALLHKTLARLPGIAVEGTP